MKTIQLIIILLTVAFLPNSTYSQEKKIETVEFEVSGVCGQCKERIENAALIRGVKFAEWDKETGILKAIYKTKHTNQQAIEEAVAEAGHDTENVKAADESYHNLPRCCAFRDGVDKH